MYRGKVLFSDIMESKPYIINVGVLVMAVGCYGQTVHLVMLQGTLLLSVLPKVDGSGYKSLTEC